MPNAHSLPRRAMLLTILAASCQPAQAEPPPTLDALMARLAARPERRADFIETRHFAALETPLESRGTLLYRHGYVEKVTTWPILERLEMDGDRLIITAGNDPPRVISAGMAPEIATLIDAVRGPLVGDAAALRRAFTPTVSGIMAHWTLDLVPHDPKLLRDVRLTGHEDQVDRLSITQANGDDQVMAITPR